MQLKPDEIQTVMHLLAQTNHRELTEGEIALRDSLRTGLDAWVSPPLPNDIDPNARTFRVTVCITGLQRPLDALAVVERAMHLHASVGRSALNPRQQLRWNWHTDGVEPPE